ncbi:MAG: hypothetical protein LBU62_08205 [Bacteroidales bacterium]|jgi:hypothetical protein|nr:hypothetical protein [Bacteroidales bacterium]
MIYTADTIEKIPNSSIVYVITHSTDFTWNFLALKISLTRLNLKITMTKDSESALAECCTELKGLLRKSLVVPNAQADIKQIIEIKP